MGSASHPEPGSSRTAALVEAGSASVRDRLGLAEAMISGAPATSTVAGDGQCVPIGVDRLPEVALRDLTPLVLANALASHGAMVVRGLIGSNDVTELRSLLGAGTVRIDDPDRPTPAQDNMVNVVCSAYRRSGFLNIAAGYIGERPVGMVQRTVVRRDGPGDRLAWHQDASFFRGPCGSLNAWTALSECGVTRPSLELVPQRVTRVTDPQNVTPQASAVMRHEVTQLLGNEAPVQPVVGPGDAIVFDEMTVHRTSSLEWAESTRDVAITWFFAPSRYPPVFNAPIAL